MTGGLAFQGQPLGQPGADSQWSAFRVDFDVEAFRQVLQSKGDICTWERAVVCPNRGGPDPRHHKITCTLCHNGFLYHSPDEQRFLLQGLTLEESYHSFGRLDVGAVSITALPGSRLGRWDRLTSHNRLNRFTELLQRSDASSVDRSKYDIVDIDIVTWIDRDDVTQTAAAADAVIDVSGGLLWTGGSAPDPGTYYSVAYTHRPRYVVTSLTHQHRVSPIEDRTDPLQEDKHYDFPVQALANLDYLIRDESLDASETKTTNPFSGS